MFLNVRKKRLQIEITYLKKKKNNDKIIKTTIKEK